MSDGYDRRRFGGNQANAQERRDVAGNQELEMADCLAGLVWGVSRRGALECLGKLGLLLLLVEATA